MTCALEDRMGALTDLRIRERAIRSVLTSGWKMAKELLNALQDATLTTNGYCYEKCYVNEPKQPNDQDFSTLL